MEAAENLAWTWVTIGLEIWRKRVLTFIYRSTGYLFYGYLSFSPGSERVLETVVVNIFPDDPVVGPVMVLA